LILKSSYITYNSLRDFLDAEDHDGIFKYVFGHSSSNTNIRRKLRTWKNWHSDLDIVKKILSCKPGSYTVGTYSYDYNDEMSYTYTVEIIWVNEIET